MKIRNAIAAGVLGVTLAACGSQPGSANWTVKEAEQHAQAKLTQLTKQCQVAEAWAEANSTQPHGFEIIGRCVR